MSEGLSEEEILDRKIIRNVPLVLDDSEDRGPCGHWLNFTGRRIYSLDRVSQAEKLLENRKGLQFVSDDAQSLNSSARPVTPAILIFDYRQFLATLDDDLKHRIWRERLCHPVAGRFPGSNGRELKLIEEALTLIARYAYPSLSFGSFSDVELHLAEIAHEADSALSPEWPNVIVRSPLLRYNISRGRSLRAADRILSVLALLHSGKLSHDLIAPADIPITELLVLSPTIRIDHRILETSN